MEKLAKYYLPASMTWWVSLVPVLGGAFIAFEPVHGLADWAEAISTMAGDIPPAVLITTGLASIGHRAAKP